MSVHPGWQRPAQKQQPIRRGAGSDAGGRHAVLYLCCTWHSTLVGSRTACSGAVRPGDSAAAKLLRPLLRIRQAVWRGTAIEC
jgi:hypothetical protein